MRLFTWLLLCLLCAVKVTAQTADFTTDVSTGCAPLVVNFTDKSTATSGTTIYAWDFGDGKSSVLKNPVTTYGTAGTYTIKLTVKNGSSGTPSTKTFAITVYPLPVIDYTATPASGCPCTLVSFKNKTVPGVPGVYTATWSFGDGHISADPDPENLYCTPGKYNVLLKVTNSRGCVNSRNDTAKIIIHEKPKADFSASKAFLCSLPDSTVFSATPSGKAPFTYSWNFGDLGTSALAKPSHKYVTPGVYTVTLVLTDANGCSDTMVRKDYIRAKLSSDFSADNVCLGNSALFTNTSLPTPDSSLWNFGDGVTARGAVVNYRYNLPGTYEVSLVNYFPGGCKDTLKRNFTVYPKPKAAFTYSPIYPCPAPATITFENKTSGATSYQWLFGDSTTSTSFSPSHTYTADKIYVVYLVAKSSFGCLDTFRVRDTSKVFPGGYPKTYYDSSNSPVIIRVYSGYTRISANKDSGCLGDPLILSAQLLTRTFLPISDTCFNRDPERGPYFWRCGLIPFPDPYPDPYYDPPYTAYPNPAPYPVHIRSYSWDFGDGSNSALSNPTHTYTTEGKYKVKLRIVTDSGCVFLDSMWVMRGLRPKADFLLPDSTCNLQNVKFTNISDSAQGYRWCFGDVPCGDYTKDSLPVYHSYKVCLDTIQISLLAYRYGCEDKKSKRLNFRPGLGEIFVRYLCDSPLNVQFQTKGCHVDQIRWRFGDGDSSNLLHPLHRYKLPGTYTVYYEAANSLSGCRFTDQTTVTVKDPRPEFTADTAICLGDTARFRAVRDSFYLDYKWIIDDHIFSDQPGKTNYLFKMAGRYTVTLTGRDQHNCYDTLTRKDYVLVSKPEARILGSPLIGCSPLRINARDTTIYTPGTSGITKNWIWDDGSSGDTGTTVSHTYTTAGTYKVQLIVTDNIGCKDTGRISVESRRPVAAFSAADKNSCLGKEVHFINSSTGVRLNYQWDLGDGTTSTAASPVHAYKSLGSYTVKLWVTDPTGCKDSVTMANFVLLTRPKASFSVKDTLALCPPLFDTMINTSAGAATYFWDFGNGSTSTLKDPIGTYIDSGRYRILLIARDTNGCTDTAESKVKVMGYDGAIRYGPLFGCAPLTVKFDIEQFAATVMLIDFADGSVEDVKGKKTTTHVYREPGAYVPQLVFGNGLDCTSFSKGLDTIRVDGVKAHFTNTSACVGMPVEFTDSSYSLYSDYYSTQWIWDGTASEYGKKVYRTYKDPGTYKVRLIAKNRIGCLDTLDSFVVVHPPPLIETRDTLICLGDEIVLSASGADSFYWMPHASLSCSSCNHPLAKPAAKGNYHYVVTGTDRFGCSNRDTLHLSVKTKAALLTDDSLEACAGNYVQLHASGAGRYSWSPAPGLTDTGIADPQARPDSTVVYRVIGYESVCTPDTAFVKVVIHPLPEVDAGPDQRVVAGTAVRLKGTVKKAQQFLWTPAETLDCDHCPEPLARPKATTQYTLKAVSAFGCSKADDVIISLYCDGAQLYLPNTFTPNGDGQNDYFYPQGSGVRLIRSFLVYNRWGQKMYERRDFEANIRELGWDGHFNGELLQPDTYVYTLEVLCDAGDAIFIKGDVTLLR